MNRLTLEQRITILERKLLILEGSEDKEKLKKYLGDDLYNAYMSIRNKIPSESDLLKQYPKYSLSELCDDANKYNKFAKNYIKLRKSNLITGVGERLWNSTPNTANKDDLDKSYSDYLAMRDFVIETFDSLRSFEKLKKLSKLAIQKFVDSYASVGDSVAKAKEGAKLLYEDQNWLVYRITTYDASKHYGRNTKWCISGNFNGHENEGQSHFDEYLAASDGGFYFYINKHDDHDKWCIIRNKQGDIELIYDSKDNIYLYPSQLENMGVDIPYWVSI